VRVLLVVLCTVTIHAESPKQAQNVKPGEASDREKAGLRGSVRTCTEEGTYPATSFPNGTQTAETRTSFTTEYTPEGRIATTRRLNGNGKIWTMRNSYDSSGRLAKTTSGNEGETPV